MADSVQKLKTATLATAAGVGFFLIFLLWVFTSWIISPGPDEFYVLVSKTGETLPPGRILAEPGQKGVQKEIHAAGWGFYCPLWWDAERYDLTVVEPGMVGVVTALDGEDLPEGQILAEILEGDGPSSVKRCHKGILREVLMPGAYRIHPKWFKVEMHKATQIPAGSVGVVVALTGKPMDAGDVLAKEGQRGIRQRILEPGTYYLNPYENKVEIIKAVEIPAGSVGVVTSRTGRPLPEGQMLAKEGERGVREKVHEPGLYFLNPYEYQVQPISLRSHKLELLKEAATGDDSIEFPSSDGFPIMIDAAIEWRIRADKVAEVYARIGDEAAILDTVIRPNARSISRIEGSKYKATDFIQGKNRELFEQSFFDQLSQVCQAKGIEIMRALVRKISVPEEIAKPIREAEVARQEKLRNIEQMETQKAAAQLAEQKALVDQQTQKVNAETKKVVAETEAKQKLAVSEIDLQTAQKEAEATVTRGKAEADVVLLKKEAEAKGYEAVVKAFGGGETYAMFNFTQMVAEKTTFVFAPVGQGTFWTDPTAFYRIAGIKAAADKENANHDK